VNIVGLIAVVTTASEAGNPSNVSMNWLAFWASVIGSLAWPLAVVAVVLALRGHLKDSLPGLKELLTDLKILRVGKFELEFDKKVAEAKVAIKATSESRPGQERQVLPPDHAAYFRDLAELSPRAAVLEAWLPFEVAAFRVAEKLGIKQRGILQVIDALVSQHILTEDQAQAVYRLRELRNAVVHARTVDLPKDSVVDYAVVLASLTAALEERA